MAKLYVIDHALFGRVEIVAPDDLGELIDLKAVTFRGNEVPTTLFYTSDSMAKLTPQSLDAFALLAPRLEAFDAIVRKSIPEREMSDWLADRADISVWRTELQEQARENLARIFPRTAVITGITRDEFIAALWLDRVQFSLDPSQSGGASLTMDYRILPIEIDGGVFAAKFDETGIFIDLVTES
jgi:hypothetical protein